MDSLALRGGSASIRDLCRTVVGKEQGSDLLTKNAENVGTGDAQCLKTREAFLGSLA